MAITVKELKEIIKDWPDENSMGEPTEVWIETGCNLSSPVVNVWNLNTRHGASDILLESAVWDEE